MATNKIINVAVKGRAEYLNKLHRKKERVRKL